MPGKLWTSIVRCTRYPDPNGHQGFQAWHILMRMSKQRALSTIQGPSRGLKYRPVKRIQLPEIKPSSYETATDRLLKKGSPALLYQSSSPQSYIFGCYAIGIGLVTAGLFNAHTAMIAPPGNFAREAEWKQRASKYIDTCAYLGSAFMIVGGIYMCLRPQNLVQKIVLLPKRPGVERSEALLSISRYRALPAMGTKQVLIRPRDVTLSSQLWMGEAAQVEREMALLARKRRYEQAFDVRSQGYLTLPIRQLAYWLSVLHGSVLKAFTNRGLIHCHLKGYSLPWKLETEAAWALQEGEVLDRLVRIKIA